VEVVVAVETVEGIQILGILLALGLAFEWVLGEVELVEGLPEWFDGVAMATVGRIVFNPPELSAADLTCMARTYQ